MTAWVRWRPVWHLTENYEGKPRLQTYCGKEMPSGYMEFDDGGSQGEWSRDARFPDVCHACVIVRDNRKKSAAMLSA